MELLLALAILVPFAGIAWALSRPTVELPERPTLDVQNHAEDFEGEIRVHILSAGEFARRWQRTIGER